MSSNFLIVCIVLVGLAVHVSLCSPELPQADDNLNIYALPVGQGDCTVIQCPRTSTVNGKGDITIIDAGTFKDHFDPKAFGNYLKGARIKYVILTHPHKDHYSLIDSILDGHTEKLKVYHSCELGKYKGVKKLNPNESSRIKKCMGKKECNTELKLCDSVTLKVIASELEECKSRETANGDSIVSMITYNGVSTLISGDLEGNDTFVTNFVQSVGNEIEANIYRLAHHGAYSGYTGTKQPNRPDLLKEVGASYYFSSSGLHARYKHPRCELYDEISSNHIYLSDQVHIAEHPYTCYKVHRNKGTKVPLKISKPIYVTTVEENGNRKDYVIRFAIKKDHTIEPTITPFDGTLKGHEEL